MKIKASIFSLFCLVLTGCGTIAYTPTEYPLRDGLIPETPVNGEVSIKNIQSSQEPAIVYSYGGTKLSTTYKDVTQVMVDQAVKELAKASQNSPSPVSKSIDLKVDYLQSDYKFFHWKSEIRYTAELGNGKTLNKVAKHGSGELYQDLNGCIAEAVIDLLNDPEVQSYLAE